MPGDLEGDHPEGVDLERLRPWFATHVDGADDQPLTAELIAGGRSNLTYTVGDGTHSWVLRRPPLGHVVATAHDMGREYRVLAALADSDVPVPKVYAFCDDLAVNDAPFYVMDHVDGRILRNPEEMATLTADEAKRCSYTLIDVLARLHSVDYEAVGLGDFGRPDGFLARNVARWGKQWQANKTRDVPAVDELARRLDAALPESGPAAIVHGDYRLDNTMVAYDDPGRIVAVLDWEMSTLGDPLTDVGLLLVYWGGGAAGHPQRPRRRRRSRVHLHRRGDRPLRRAVGPLRRAARLLRRVRDVQADGDPRRHQRALPHGQDAGRRLRRHGPSGDGARRARSRARLDGIGPTPARLSAPSSRGGR